VKTLNIPQELIGVLSHSLEPEDGESGMEVLPELKELSYLASDNAQDAFSTFIDARQNAGRPVTVFRR
jgi:hypothetical protein